MERFKFLIVDDELYSRKLLKRILEEEGHEVLAEAEDGNDAIKKYREHSPDFVFMDLVMPGRGGVSALRKIVENDSEAKVIILSAVGQKRIIMEALEAGAINYLTKPYRPNDIIEKLNKTIELMNN